MGRVREREHVEFSTFSEGRRTGWRVPTKVTVDAYGLPSLDEWFDDSAGDRMSDEDSSPPPRSSAMTPLKKNSKKTSVTSKSIHSVRTPARADTDSDGWAAYDEYSPVIGGGDDDDVIPWEGDDSINEMMGDPLSPSRAPTGKTAKSRRTSMTPGPKTPRGRALATSPQQMLDEDDEVGSMSPGGDAMNQSYGESLYRASPMGNLSPPPSPISSPESSPEPVKQRGRKKQIIEKIKKAKAAEKTPKQKRGRKRLRVESDSSGSDSEGPGPKRANVHTPASSLPKHMQSVMNGEAHNPSPGVVTRGGRKSRKPLDFWRNERVEYGERDSKTGAFGIASVVHRSKTPTPKKRVVRRGLRTAAGRKAAAKGTAKLPKEKCSPDLSKMVSINHMDFQEAKHQPGYSMSVAFSTDGLKVGVARLSAGTEITRTNNKDPKVLTVLQGAAEIVVDEETALLHTGGQAVVLAGSEYRIRNPSKSMDLLVNVFVRTVDDRFIEESTDDDSD